MYNDLFPLGIGMGKASSFSLPHEPSTASTASVQVVAQRALTTPPVGNPARKTVAPASGEGGYTAYLAGLGVFFM